VVGSLVDRMSARPETVPISTYRLQFNGDFGFADATAIVPYLRDLGIGHIYASPYLRARAGSTHGYDIIDHNVLNPEVGAQAEHAEMIATAQAAGIGHILDFVPNHMGIGPDNPWWRDVLEWGEISPYARYFDIEWHPLQRELQGKVLAPVLGDHFGRVLENGELTLGFEPRSGEFVVAHFENRFPLSLKSYARILHIAAEADAPALAPLAADFAAMRSRSRDGRKQRAIRARGTELKAQLAELARDPGIAQAIEAALAEYDVTIGEPSTADALDELLGEQYYRLTYWRVAVDEINYRRFFDINDLAGLRVEDARVLGETHRLVFAMIGDGRLQGLRIDHIDGLYNPGDYCNLLQNRASALGQPLYIVVEKILAPFEELRSSWLIAGTTGYDFMNLLNGLFVDSRTENAFDRIYARFTGRAPDYEAIVRAAKLRIMTVDLASELTVLATALSRLAASDRRSSDYTYNGLRQALTEIIAAFPVYRTYVVSEDIDEDDRIFIDAAVALAAHRSSLLDKSIFAFIGDILTLAAVRAERAYDRSAVLRFAMRFAQYTGPVMAKSVEDTAFYRYLRLTSLNEVGGDPLRFGTSVYEFHKANAQRATQRPHTMLATATHDHKRGEDTRIRIDALTEVPAGWSRALRRWTHINRSKRSTVNGAPAPSPNDEYLFYQTLVGTWPVTWREPAAIDDADYENYVERMCAYLLKAQREAKLVTSWATPDLAYEEATTAFVRATLDRTDIRFPKECAEFASALAPAAMVASLAQVVLKYTAPGVPDTYQGCELWDHSLVDPDNRRPVDYAQRRQMLARVQADPPSALTSWDDGAVKLYVTWCALQLRARRRETFLDGAYTPLEISGTHSEHIVAFARDTILTVTPRLAANLIVPNAAGPRVRFSDERVHLGHGAATRYKNVFTGEIIVPENGTIAIAKLLDRFPVAVLEPA
jgi:(1->4)-alpha-D-glucan 1-alpha-D-glucosylmutase